MYLCPLTPSCLVLCPLDAACVCVWECMCTCFLWAGEAVSGVYLLYSFLSFSFLQTHTVVFDIPDGNSRHSWQFKAIGEFPLVLVTASAIPTGTHMPHSHLWPTFLPIKTKKHNSVIPSQTPSLWPQQAALALVFLLCGSLVWHVLPPPA